MRARRTAPRGGPCPRPPPPAAPGSPRSAQPACAWAHIAEQYTKRRSKCLAWCKSWGRSGAGGQRGEDPNGLHGARRLLARYHVAGAWHACAPEPPPRRRLPHPPHGRYMHGVRHTRPPRHATRAPRSSTLPPCLPLRSRQQPRRTKPPPPPLMTTPTPAPSPSALLLRLPFHHRTTMSPPLLPHLLHALPGSGLRCWWPPSTASSCPPASTAREALRARPSAILKGGGRETKSWVQVPSHPSHRACAARQALLGQRADGRRGGERGKGPSIMVVVQRRQRLLGCPCTDRMRVRYYVRYHNSLPAQPN